MITQTHTIILATDRISIPEKEKIKNLVSVLINKNLCNVEYFGGELDNQADYIDETEQKRIDSTTFLTFHFDTDTNEIIDYSQNKDSILNKVLFILRENKIRDVISDGKDIDVYIY